MHDLITLIIILLPRSKIILLSSFSAHSQVKGINFDGKQMCLCVFGCRWEQLSFQLTSVALDSH